MDAEKDIYSSCYEKVIPDMVKGGILVADNAINHMERIIENAISKVIQEGKSITSDLGGTASTSEFTEEVLSAL